MIEFHEVLFSPIPREEIEKLLPPKRKHMIRDFQKLSGLSPEYLLGRLGDMRPPAHAGASSLFQTSQLVPGDRAMRIL